MASRATTTSTDRQASPRDHYHHGDLRTALVAAGLELSRTSGPAGLGLREVTRRVGVSPTAAYRHFADRDALVRAVSHEIQERMARRMRRAAPPRSSDDREEAIGALRAVGLGYIRFALSEPGWFGVAFFGGGPPAPEPIDGDGPAWVPPPYAMLVAALDQLVVAGVLPAEQRPGAEWPCFSTVHGFASLALYGPLHGQPRSVLDRLARRAVDTIVEGLVPTD